MLLIRDAKPEDAARLLEIYGPYVENTAISFEYETPGLEEFKAAYAPYRRTIRILFWRRTGKSRATPTPGSSRPARPTAAPAR